MHDRDGRSGIAVSKIGGGKIRRVEVKGLLHRVPSQWMSYAGHQTPGMTVYKDYMPPEDYKGYMLPEDPTVVRKLGAPARSSPPSCR